MSYLCESLWPRDIQMIMEKTIMPAQLSNSLCQGRHRPHLEGMRCSPLHRINTPVLIGYLRRLQCEACSRASTCGELSCLVAGTGGGCWRRWRAIRIGRKILYAAHEDMCAWPKKINDA